jgi:hypothetical protein
LAFLRQVAHLLFNRREIGEIKARVNPEVANFLVNYKRLELTRLEERHKAKVIVNGDDRLNSAQWEIDAYRSTAEGDNAIKPGRVAGQSEEAEDEAFDNRQEFKTGTLLGHFSSQGGLFMASHAAEGSNGHGGNGQTPANGTHLERPSSKRHQKSRKNREPKSEAPFVQVA